MSSAMPSGPGQDGVGAPWGPPSPTSTLEMPGAAHLSAEARLVLLVARLSPSPEGLEHAALLARTPGFRWEAALDLACRLWVHPLLARATHLADSPLAGLPPAEVQDGLRLAEFAARIRWESYVRALAPALRGWEREGIQATLLKGAALQTTLFPSGTRFLNDVDLWVPRDRLETAARVLMDAGFVRSAEDESLTPDHRARLSAWTFVLTKPGALNALTVDLHHKLFRDEVPFRMDAAACTAVGRVVPMGDAQVAVFTPEDATVLLACHIAKDMIVKLQTVVDLAALLSMPSGQSGPDFTALEERAREIGAEGPTALALRWAHAAGAAVPRNVIGRLNAAASWAAPGNAVLFDLRAVLPGYRIRRVAVHPLKLKYAPTAPGGWATFATTLRALKKGDGRTKGAWAVAYLWARSLPLVALSLVLARTAAMLLARGAFRRVGRLNTFFWPGREEGRNV